MPNKLQIVLWSRMMLEVYEESTSCPHRFDTEMPAVAIPSWSTWIEH